MSAEDVARYRAAAHAVQTGIATEQGMGSSDGTPKHLRTGIACTQSSVSALALLLIERGVFTLDEYEAANAAEMEAEQRRYEERLTAATGITVTLS